MLAPGDIPMFLKPKLPERSKFGFKTINCCPYPALYLKKNYYSAQKIIKKIEHLLILNFLCQYICINKTSSESLEIKCFRTGLIYAFILA
jgi:hypothetical protein